MSDLLIAVVGIAGTFLSGLIMFAMGRRSEQQHQSLLVRAEMLQPIEEWLGGAEKMLQIVADTMAGVSQGLPLPMTYSMEERRQAAQFMGEKSRVVWGILESGSLKTRKTKKLTDDLKTEITTLQVSLPVILNMENEILGSASNRLQGTDVKYVVAGQMLQELGARIGRAYSLIAQIKTSFV